MAINSALIIRKLFRLAPLAHAVLCALLAAPLSALEPSPTGPLTQNRINEFAASCQTCQMAFSGLKGTPKPGETPPQFAARVESYVSALDKLARQLQPLKKPLSIHNAQLENMTQWKKVTVEISHLPTATSDIRAAWHVYKLGGDQHQLGSKLMTALLLVQSVLNALRDARP